MFGDAKEPELPFVREAKLGTQIILVQVIVERRTFSVVDDLCNSAGKVNIENVKNVGWINKNKLGLHINWVNFYEQAVHCFVDEVTKDLKIWNCKLGPFVCFEREKNVVNIDPWVKVALLFLDANYLNRAIV